jgi:hypothetical protein
VKGEIMTSIRWYGFAALAASVVLVAACAPPPTPHPTTTTTTTTTVPDSGRYVAASGTDSGDCSTHTAPCATITYAVSEATDGETVHVGAGTYDELVIVTKPLRFEGANAGISAGATPGTRGAESIVKGFRTPGEPHPNATGEYSVTVDGFTIDPQGDASLIAPNTHHLVALFGGPDVEVANNVFDGGPWVPDCDATCTTMTDAAVMVRSGTYQVKDNSFTDFRRPMDVDQDSAAHPVVSGTISGNSFTHVTSRAIWISEYPGGPLPHTITVSDNTFDATGWTGTDYPAGIVVTAGGNRIEDNTFTGFSSGVFVEVCDGTNVDGVTNSFARNTFADNRIGLQFYVAGACGATTVDASINGNSFDGGTWSGPGAPAKIGVGWNESDATRPNDLIASCNYWGAATGANTPGAATASAGVGTSPWQTTPSGLCDGV